MARDTKTGGRKARTGVISGSYALAVGMPTMPLPKGWFWEPLTSLARLESGHTPSRRHPEYWGGEIPWIGIKDATSNYGLTIADTIQHTNQLGIDNSSARVLPTGTVCLSRTASVGYVIIMGQPMATSQDFVNWVCSDELNNHFLKYILIAERKSLDMFSMGTTHQTIYFPEVKGFHIAKPPRAEQDEIVRVLLSLDDKIELNRRMNETLEAMARAVFKDWFVDFGPTRRKAAGDTDPVQILGGLLPDPTRAARLAALFPDSFGEDGLPKGWEERPLDQIADFLNGLALQKYPAKPSDDSLPVIKIAELRNGITAKSNRASRDVPQKFVLKDGDYIFSWSGSLMAKYWTEGEGALNQHLFKVTSDTHPIWMVSAWVEHHLAEFQRIAAAKAVTMGHIKRSHLSEAICVLPSPESIGPMGEIIEPLLRLMIQNELENQTLAATRDLLLPKLMSGEILLKEAVTAE